MQRNQLRFVIAKRQSIVVGLFFVLLFLIIIKFFLVQVVQHNYFEKKSVNNSIKLIPIAPSRGLIVDRNNKVLAANKLIYNIELDPNKKHDFDNIRTHLRSIISISDADVEQYHRITKENYYSSTVPIKSDLSQHQVASFLARQYLVDQVSLVPRLERFYPFNEYSSHVVGYINRINKGDVDKLRRMDKIQLYKGTDHIGKTGVELMYENSIHGFPGFKKIEVDAKGNVIRTIESQEPEHGQTIQLTIDIDLQKIAIEAFQDQSGALIAMDPNNGEILAYVSQPDFNPNLFINGIDHKNWNKLNNDKSKPLLDRVIHGVYPPGSTLKPFVAMAALENNLRKPPYKMFDPGYFTMPNGSKTFRDWKREGHGEVDLVKALAVSCDTFFYSLGLELGIIKINNTLSNFGFGKVTGVDLLNEKKGLLANEEWKKNKKNKRWFAGETVITAIGQGYTQVTPIQLASATTKIAVFNGGNQPHLKLGRFLPLSKNAEKKEMSTSTDLMHYIRKGMEDVTAPGGTAAFLANDRYKIAAKTGTAQVFGLKGGEYIEDDLPDHLKDHALLIAYAPANRPQLVIAVVVEHGGSGGTTAGPIAKKVFDYYLKNYNNE